MKTFREKCAGIAFSLSETRAGKNEGWDADQALQGDVQERLGPSQQDLRAVPLLVSGCQ